MLSTCCVVVNLSQSINKIAGDVETRKAVTTWTLGDGSVEHQQVGNTWAGKEDIVSLSLGGDLNIFDRRTGDRPARILYVRSHVSLRLELVILNPIFIQRALKRE